jgi:hypothetical protein
MTGEPLALQQLCAAACCHTSLLSCKALLSGIACSGSMALDDRAEDMTTILHKVTEVVSND